jgi:hypothetical protein
MMKTQDVMQVTDELKNWVRGLLHDSKDLCVVFTKKDGTQREMFCTLNEGRIPADKLPKSQASDSPTAGQGNDTAIRVFDTSIQEWRSFRWDTVKHVRFEL